ncbi:hypothetical protein DTO012A8_8603 [Penicillium roqueforti]|nr:hypothetical protein DTO012A8_8603 [Penicillium roqueforti]
MSTTSVTTLVIPAMKGVVISENKCPMCWGEGFPQDGSGAHDRIQELEGQVHTLTARALAAASTKTNSAVSAPPSPKEPTTPRAAALHWEDPPPEPTIHHHSAQHPQNLNPNDKHTTAASQT